MKKISYTGKNIVLFKLLLKFVSFFVFVFTLHINAQTVVSNGRSGATYTADFAYQLFENAAEGDTLYILTNFKMDDRDYKITKNNLTIIGTGSSTPVITSGYSSDEIFVYGTNIVISNINFYTISGITCKGGSLDIFDCQMTRVTYGVVLDYNDTISGRSNRIINCDFFSNSMTSVGIYHEPGHVLISNCHFYSNTGDYAVRLGLSTLSLESFLLIDSVFSNNYYYDVLLRDDVSSTEEITIDSCFFYGSHKGLMTHAHGEMKALRIVNSTFKAPLYLSPYMDTYDFFITNLLVSNCTFHQAQFTYHNIQTETGLIVDNVFNDCTNDYYINFRPYPQTDGQPDHIIFANNDTRTSLCYINSYGGWSFIGNTLSNLSIYFRDEADHSYTSVIAGNTVTGVLSSTHNDMGSSSNICNVYHNHFIGNSEKIVTFDEIKRGRINFYSNTTRRACFFRVYGSIAEPYSVSLKYNTFSNKSVGLYIENHVNQNLDFVTIAHNDFYMASNIYTGIAVGDEAISNMTLISNNFIGTNFHSYLGKHSSSYWTYDPLATSYYYPNPPVRELDLINYNSDLIRSDHAFGNTGQFPLYTNKYGSWASSKQAAAESPSGSVLYLHPEAPVAYVVHATNVTIDGGSVARFGRSFRSSYYNITTNYINTLNAVESSGVIFSNFYVPTMLTLCHIKKSTNIYITHNSFGRGDIRLKLGSVDNLKNVIIEQCTFKRTNNNWTSMLSDVNVENMIFRSNTLNINGLCLFVYSDVKNSIFHDNFFTGNPLSSYGFIYDSSMNHVVISNCTFSNYEKVLDSISGEKITFTDNRFFLSDYEECDYRAFNFGVFTNLSFINNSFMRPAPVDGVYNFFESSVYVPFEFASYRHGADFQFRGNVVSNIYKIMDIRYTTNLDISSNIFYGGSRILNLLYSTGIAKVNHNHFEQIPTYYFDAQTNIKTNDYTAIDLYSAEKLSELIGNDFVSYTTNFYAGYRSFNSYNYGPELLNSNGLCAQIAYDNTVRYYYPYNYGGGGGSGGSSTSSVSPIKACQYYAGHWQMASLPVKSGVSGKAFFGGSPDGEYNVALSWNGDAGYTTADTLKPSEAYVILPSSNIVYELSSNIVNTSTNVKYYNLSEAGWHLIGNPWTLPLDIYGLSLTDEESGETKTWQEGMTTGWIDGTVASLSGSYYGSSYIHASSGAWIYTKKKDLKLSVPYAAQTSTVTYYYASDRVIPPGMSEYEKTSRMTRSFTDIQRSSFFENEDKDTDMSGYEYNLALELKNAHGVVQNLRAGAYSASKDPAAPRLYTLRFPPAPSGMSCASFSASGESYLSRGVSADGKTHLYNVDTSQVKEGKVTVSLNHTSVNYYTPFIRTLADGRPVRLDPDGTQVGTSAGRFEIIMADPDTTTSLDSGRELYEVYNYPNPAVKETTIRFCEVISGDIDTAFLSIYNTKGSLVCQDELTVYEEGAFTYHWDGITMKGKQVSPGIYIIKVYYRTVRGNEGHLFHRAAFIR